MNFTAVRKIGVFCICGLFFCAASVSAQNDRAFYFSFKVPGSLQTSPTAINNFFTVTGTYTDARGSHGFVREVFGRITRFHVPGSTSTSPVAINDDGMIVGTYTDSSNVTHGFLRHREGNITRIDPSGSTGTYLTGISAFGDISGYAFDSSTESLECFVRSPQGIITVFGPPHCKATSINVFGSITGFSEPPNVMPGGPPPEILVVSFVRSPAGVITYFTHPGTSANGCFSQFIDASGETAGFFQNQRDISQNFLGATSITPPGSSPTATLITALSPLGAAVGSYSLPNGGGSHAFVQNQQGVFTSFDFPGGSTYPTGINAFGVIIGSGNGAGILRIPY